MDGVEGSNGNTVGFRLSDERVDIMGEDEEGVELGVVDDVDGRMPKGRVWCDEKTDGDTGVGCEGRFTVFSGVVDD